VEYFTNFVIRIRLMGCNMTEFAVGTDRTTTDLARRID